MPHWQIEGADEKRPECQQSNAIQGAHIAKGRERERSKLPCTGRKKPEPEASQKSELLNFFVVTELNWDNGTSTLVFYLGLCTSDSKIFLNMVQQVLRTAHSLHFFPPPFPLATKSCRDCLLLSPSQTFHIRSIFSKRPSTGHMMCSTSASNKDPIPFSYNCNDVGMGFNPHAYTSGRWLRRDKEERASRYISFDFQALCHKVLELSPGASTITRCQKLEGGFNRVFIFELNNNKRMVARLPFTLAGPAQLTTSSEIATIRYCELESGFYWLFQLTVERSS